MDVGGWLPFPLVRSLARSPLHKGAVALEAQLLPEHLYFVGRSVRASDHVLVQNLLGFGALAEQVVVKAAPQAVDSLAAPRRIFNE